MRDGAIDGPEAMASWSPSDESWEEYLGEWHEAPAPPGAPAEVSPVGELIWADVSAGTEVGAVWVIDRHGRRWTNLSPAGGRATSDLPDFENGEGLLLRWDEHGGVWVSVTGGEGA